MIVPSRDAVIAIGAFALAAVLALGGATGAVHLIERQTRAEIATLLQGEGFDWTEVATDGLLVTLSGESPTEAARFRALTIAATVVDGARVLDEIAVTPSLEVAAPPFQMEILRNRDDVSVIGLVPLAHDPEALVARIAALAPDIAVSEMLETADHALPAGWDRAVGFAIEAMRVLPVSKVSVTPGQVTVSALATDAQNRRELETRLLQSRPQGVEVTLEINAPRPVITPFTLRFTIDDGLPRFDACSADTEAGREMILQAARDAGLAGNISCTLGMGAPSSRWAQAASQSIAALHRLGAGAVTMSDTEVSLVVPHIVSAGSFDRVAGELESALPDVFSLQSVRLNPPDDTAERDDAPTEFVAALSPEGVLNLHGRLTDERTRDAVQAYARARFGWGAVQMGARLDESLPEGWPLKTLAAIEALSELDSGTVTVRPDRIELRGVTGNAEASDTVSRILSDKLGQGADFSVNVTYDESLDPASQIPTPERCEGWIRDILAEGQITFAPGSARIDDEAASTLDQIADVMRECGALEMEIGGHTDSQGSADGNLALSQRRADSVLDALMARQVLISGLVAKGYGEENPIADNATAAGREANRRIEFRLLSRIDPEPFIPLERDPELEATLEIRVTEGTGDQPRPERRPENLRVPD